MPLPETRRLAQEQDIVHVLLLGPGLRRILLGFAVGLGGAILVTMLGLSGDFSPALERPFYGLLVLIAAVVGGLWPGVSTAALSFVLFVRYFVSPTGELIVWGDEVFVLATYLVAAVLVTWLEAARISARTSRQRLVFLAEASALLGSSLDYRKTIAKLTRLAVPGLADWCAIHVRGPGTKDFEVEVAHSDPSKAREVRQLWERYPPSLSEQGQPVARALVTGRPVLLSRVPRAVLEQAARDPEHLSRLRALGIRSAIVVPLEARGRIFGALTLAHAESGRRYRHSDLEAATQLGRSAAAALDNARLYRDRSQVARTLSESLLPSDLPEIPGIEVAARFRPAGEGNLVGGDFYDLFEAGPGDWVVVVGDVCGKGPEAAALTGLVRHTIRAVSMRERVPSAVLGIVNRHILGSDGDRFCTVAYGRLQQEGGALRLTVSCGGHPPPLLFRAGRSVEAADSLGTLLGVLPDPRLVDAPADLHPGDTVVFYTDGVMEPYERAREPSEARIVSLLWDCADLDAASIAERLDSDSGGFREGPPRDDVAIMVLKVVSPLEKRGSIRRRARRT